MKIICKLVDNKELLKTQNNKYYFDENINKAFFSDNITNLWDNKEVLISYQGYGYQSHKLVEEFDDTIIVIIKE